MFSIPDREELGRQRDEEYARWLSRRRGATALILGGGPAGLAAGVVLQQNDVSSLIVEEAEQLGGRLTWESGPLPVFSPAHELLAEFGLEVSQTPPLWLDRLQLFDLLVHAYFEAGGRALTGGTIQHPPRSNPDEEGFLLDLYLGDRTEVIEAEEVIVTLPLAPPGRAPRDSESVLEQMVLATGRRQDDWIQAGFQALPSELRDRSEPYLNGCLLSGRKAAEVILNLDE